MNALLFATRLPLMDGSKPRPITLTMDLQADKAVRSLLETYQDSLWHLVRLCALPTPFTQGLHASDTFTVHHSRHLIDCRWPCDMICHGKDQGYARMVEGSQKSALGNKICCIRFAIVKELRLEVLHCHLHRPHSCFVP